MFKRKKKPIIREANPPKVLKTWDNYRLVVKEIPVMTKFMDQVGDSVQTGWKQQLVLEEKNTNAMKEPYFVTKEEDYYSDAETSSYYGRHEYRYISLLFKILKEEYLKNE